MPKCKLCDEEVKRKHLKYCSRECYRKAPDQTWFKDGHKGLEGEKNPEWKGDDAGYRALHSWAYRRLVRPKNCVKCEKPNKTLDTKTGPRQYLQLANVSGEYKRSLDDWMFLCPSCHTTYDLGRNSIKQVFLNTNRANP